MAYAKLLREETMTHVQLADVVGYTRAKFENFLTFEKVPGRIWEAVGNMSRVTSITSATIYALAKNGSIYEEALIDLADEIRKGVGCTMLEGLVLALVNKDQLPNDLDQKITLPNGMLIATWTKEGLQFSSKINFDKIEINQLLIEFFQKKK